ncbi:hypothetical protein C8J57DRAFT_1230726 [Mycena rebaudengoi]|nr:hypothetical protein C8J57DRAFT_1230726 [Mycena rebaudengoi]
MPKGVVVGRGRGEHTAREWCSGMSGSVGCGSVRAADDEEEETLLTRMQMQFRTPSPSVYYCREQDSKANINPPNHPNEEQRDEPNDTVQTKTKQRNTNAEANTINPPKKKNSKERTRQKKKETLMDAMRWYTKDATGGRRRDAPSIPPPSLRSIGCRPSTRDSQDRTAQRRSVAQRMDIKGRGRKEKKRRPKERIRKRRRATPGGADDLGVEGEAVVEGDLGVDDLGVDRDNDGDFGDEDGEWGGGRECRRGSCGEGGGGHLARSGRGGGGCRVRRRAPRVVEPAACSRDRSRVDVDADVVRSRVDAAAWTSTWTTRTPAQPQTADVDIVRGRNELKPALVEGRAFVVALLLVLALVPRAGARLFGEALVLELDRTIGGAGSVVAEVLLLVVINALREGPAMLGGPGPNGPGAPWGRTPSACSVVLMGRIIESVAGGITGLQLQDNESFGGRRYKTTPRVHVCQILDTSSKRPSLALWVVVARFGSEIGSNLNRTEPNARFRFKVQQIPEPERQVRFEVHRLPISAERVRTRSNAEPNGYFGLQSD